MCGWALWAIGFTNSQTEKKTVARWFFRHYYFRNVRYLKVGLTSLLHFVKIVPALHRLLRWSVGRQWKRRNGAGKSLIASGAPATHPDNLLPVLYPPPPTLPLALSFYIDVLEISYSHFRRILLFSLSVREMQRKMLFLATAKKKVEEWREKIVEINIYYSLFELLINNCILSGILPLTPRVSEKRVGRKEEVSSHFFSFPGRIFVSFPSLNIFLVLHRVKIRFWYRFFENLIYSQITLWCIKACNC